MAQAIPNRIGAHGGRNRNEVQVVPNRFGAQEGRNRNEAQGKPNLIGVQVGANSNVDFRLHALYIQKFLKTLDAPLGEPHPLENLVSTNPKTAGKRMPLYARKPRQEIQPKPQLPKRLPTGLQLFRRYPLPVLFYVFYHLERTKAQYLAAIALKERSWRFHKKYCMWLVRAQEPSIITDDFEKGLYLYWDAMHWRLSAIKGFVFHYKYIEDDVL